MDLGPADRVVIVAGASAGIGRTTVELLAAEGAYDDAWRSTLELNLLTAVRTTRAALSALLERGGGIVHVASEAAHLPDGFDTFVLWAEGPAQLPRFAEEVAPAVRAQVARERAARG